MMLYYNRFVKYIILGFNFFGLNYINSMEAPDEGFEFIQETNIKNFKIKIENKTEYNLSVESRYRKVKESAGSFDKFDLKDVVGIDQRLVLSYESQAVGNVFYLAGISIDYEKGVFSHKLELPLDQIFKISDAGKYDILVTLTRQMVTNKIVFEISKLPLEFSDLEEFKSIKFMNLENKSPNWPVLIRRIFIKLDNNIESKIYEYQLIKPDASIKFVIPEGKRILDINMAFVKGELLKKLNEFELDNQNIESFIEVHKNDINNLSWVEFINKDLLNNYNQDRHSFKSPAFYIKATFFGRKPWLYWNV